MALNYIVWNVNPYIFTFPENFPLLGGRPIAWYGLLWALVFLFGYWIMKKIFKKENISDDYLDKLLMYMLIFTIIGARLGHCLFYEPSYYFSDPIKFLYVWEGGLASHGGAIGILIGLFIYSRKVKKPYLWILDRIVIPVSIGGAFIRIGNLMNSEILRGRHNPSLGIQIRPRLGSRHTDRHDSRLPPDTNLRGISLHHRLYRPDDTLFQERHHQQISRILLRILLRRGLRLKNTD